MMDIATLGLAVDSRPVADASRELDRIREAAGKAERAADSFGARTDAAGKRAAAANDNVARSAQKVDTIYGKLIGTMKAFGGALAGAFSIRVIAQMADTWSDLSARVGLAIRDMDGAGAVMDRLATVARRTYSSLALTNESFIANSTALRELGFTTAQQLDYVEGLNLALVVSGARAERAASVQNALSQAMALGVLRGDQLNTVIMSGGRVAELLAEELGVGVNQLRALGTQGVITGDVINRALTGNLERLREEAELMPATIGDGFTLIGNAALQLVGNFDQALGASETFAAGLIVIADNLQRLVTYAATAATAFGTYYVVAMGAAYLSTITFTAALAALRVMLLRLGITAIVIAAGELAYQFSLLVQAAGGFGNAMALLGDVAREVWERIKLGAAALVASMTAGWEGMKADFFHALHDMAAGFASFIGGVASALNSVFGTSLNTSPMGDMLLGLQTAGNDALERRNASRSAASGMWADVSAPLQSIEAIRQVMADAAKETDNAASAVNRMNTALGSVADGGSGGRGGSAKSAKDGIDEFGRQAAQVAQDVTRYWQDMAGNFVSTFQRSMEQGRGFLRSLGDAALSVLQDITQQLIKMATNRLITGLLGNLLGGSFLSPAAAGVVASGQMTGLFQNGGWTGNGPIGAAAGIVHGQEFVVKAGPAAQYRRLLEAMNAGQPVASNGNAPGAANGNGGHSVVELRMSPEVEARIVEQTGNQTVRLLQASNKARANYQQNGG